MKIIPNAYNTSGRLAPQNAESNWRAQISFGEISGARSLPIRDWCDGDKASGAFMFSSGLVNRNRHRRQNDAGFVHAADIRSGNGSVACTAYSLAHD